MLKNLNYYLCALLVTVASTVNAVEVTTQLGGTTLNADLVTAEGVSVAGDVVVIVHGTLGHKDMDIIETLQEALQEQSYDSLAINLSLNLDDRHGFYPCDTQHTHLSSDAENEIATWINWLQSQGGKRVFLMGHSLGANQAAKFALAKPKEIAALVALAPPSGGSVSTDAQVALLNASTSDSDWLVDVDFLHCENATVQVASYLSYRGPEAGGDTIAIVEQVHVPTLVISGSEDTVSPDLSSKMEAVANEFVQHAEIDGAGHFFRDLYAYDVVDLAIEFFGAIEEVPSPVEMASSFKEDALLLAASGKMLVVLVSKSDCAYCALLREQVLDPAIRSGDVDPRIEIREVSLDESFRVVNFQGATVSGSEFAATYGAYVTPTVLFLDEQGNSLAEPLVGIGNIEFYNVYLQRKIDAAEAAR